MKVKKGGGWEIITKILLGIGIIIAVFIGYTIYWIFTSKPPDIKRRYR
jgi:hypothetical protein